MPLEDSCSGYINRMIYIWPVIGYGWSAIEPDAPADQPGAVINPPPPFQAKIFEFNYLENRIVAGIGVIEQKLHLSHNKWVAFCLRDRELDFYNLTTNPGKYSIRVGEVKPTIVIDKNLPMPQWMCFTGSPILSGVGFIGESRMWIKNKYEWIE